MTGGSGRVNDLPKVSKGLKVSVVCVPLNRSFLFCLVKGSKEYIFRSMDLFSSLATLQVSLPVKNKQTNKTGNHFTKVIYK